MGCGQLGTAHVVTGQRGTARNDEDRERGAPSSAQPADRDEGLTTHPFSLRQLIEEQEDDAQVSPQEAEHQRGPDLLGERDCFFEQSAARNRITVDEIDEAEEVQDLEDARRVAHPPQARERLGEHRSLIRTWGKRP